MKLATHIFALFILFICNHVTAAEDFNQQVQATLEKYNPIREELRQLLIIGQLDQANNKLLALFPEQNRTAAEYFALGNWLYDMDWKKSYDLHKKAFELEPNNSSVQLEWAMQQHRAGEYAGALQAYDAFSQTHPDFAPVHGLAADCLLRLDRIADAVKRWETSENAKDGSLNKLEELVCAIYLEKNYRRERSDLRALVEQGDVDAAVKLIALDCDFTTDWWNGGPNYDYLHADLPLLEKLPNNDRVKAMCCLVKRMIAYGEDEKGKTDKMRQYLLSDGLLIDDKHTFAPDVAINNHLINLAIGIDVCNYEQAHAWFTPKLQANALDSTDAATFHLWVSFMLDDPGIILLLKRGWKQTNDELFAIGYLSEQLRAKQLTSDDPDLLKAMKQYPNSANIFKLALEVTDNPPADLLVQSLKAEYRHFSTRFFNGMAVPLSAQSIRTYFSKLDKIMNQQQPPVVK